MRLSEKEQQVISSATAAFLADEPATLYLYGSRVHDDLKGGDIDIVLVPRSSAVAAHLRRNRHRLLSRLKQELGERRIDLSIAAESELQDEPFWTEALRDAVQLYPLRS